MIPKNATTWIQLAILTVKYSHPKCPKQQPPLEIICTQTDHLKPHSDTVGFIAGLLHHLALGRTDVLHQINRQHFIR